MSSLSELEKMKVPDLKAALKLKGLNTVGNKKQLIERLIDSSSNNKTEDEDDEVNEDYVLGGEGDESIEDDQISEQSDRLLINDVFMSPASKTSLVSNNNSTPEKENNAISAAKTTVVVEAVSKKTAVTAAIEVGEEAETDKAAVAASPAAVKALTEQERRDLRMKRFDPTASSDQKLARAQRFGLAEKGVGTLTDSKVSNTDVNSLDKLKQRANRFGVTSSTSLIKTEDKDRILKRKARFGIGINLGQMADEEARKKVRAERFSINK